MDLITVTAVCISSRICCMHSIMYLFDVYDYMYSKSIVVSTFSHFVRRKFHSTLELNYRFFNLIHAIFVSGAVIVCTSHTTESHLDFVLADFF